MQTILVVEDDMNLREIISYNLDLEGREVLECANGPEALALLSEKGRQVDLVVLDLALPAMNGLEVVRHMREHPRLQFIPVLLCTGKPHTDIVAGLDSGANDFICKPFSIKRDLSMRVNVLLNRKAMSKKETHHEDGGYYPNLQRSRKPWYAFASHFGAR